MVYGFFHEAELLMTDDALESAPAELSTTRRGLIELGLFGLMFGAGYDMYTRREHWPFSTYPMFGRIRREAEVLHHALLAIPGDGSAAFPLYKSSQIHPFHWYRHRRAFKTMLQEPGGEEAARRGLADCLRRYERARLEGRHDGPPLRAIRLYRVQWMLDPDAPDLVGHEERTFVAEATTQDERVDR